MPLLSRKVEQGRPDERMHRRSGGCGSEVCTGESIDELNNKNGNGKDECHEEMITCESGKT